MNKEEAIKLLKYIELMREVQAEYYSAPIIRVKPSYTISEEQRERMKSELDRFHKRLEECDIEKIRGIMFSDFERWLQSNETNKDTK